MFDKLRKKRFVSVSRWNGTPATADDRTEGIILRVGDQSIVGNAIEVEMSYEEWGRVLAHLGGVGTERVR
jgi:hypothetical protein